MSNKLWRKKHEFVVDRKGEVFVKLDDGTYDIIWVRKDKPLQDVGFFSENGIKFIEEYCYLDDLIAQADKAERLQKAVDKALDTLDYVSNEKFATEDGDFFEEYEEMHKAIKQDIDEIKQLIKVE